MSPAMLMTAEATRENEFLESQYNKGVKHLCESGITRVPPKYILPVQERPNLTSGILNASEPTTLKLPLIDFAELRGPNRARVLESLSYACENYGFFQLVNHGIPCEVINNMRDVAARFFELPLVEREKYMTSNMGALVRYGTSFNQSKDGIFCWRDFLKLVCHPLSDVLSHWPSSPLDFRKSAVTYAKETKKLFLMLAEAILESLLLGSVTTNKNKTELGVEEEEEEEADGDGYDILKEFEDGSQLMIVNCYPPCPQPELTLGMPPHSDYGFLTLVLQDDVEGLQIQSQDKWVTIQPIPDSFVVNVGDHLEIFSNGRYKSVLHRVLVNSIKSRISVASLHSLPFTRKIRPLPELINETNPRRYKDTDFSDFLDYISSCDAKKKNFLQSRKLT